MDALILFASLACVCVALICFRASRRRSVAKAAPEPIRLTPENDPMTLSAKAQALADELATLPALQRANTQAAVDAAVAAEKASHAEDLDALKTLVDEATGAAPVAPPPSGEMPVVVEGPVVEAPVIDPTAPQGA